MYKKLFLTLLLILALTLVACGGDDEDEPADETAAEETAAEEEVAEEEMAEEPAVSELNILWAQVVASKISGGKHSKHTWGSCLWVGVCTDYSRNSKTCPASVF